MRTRPFSYLLFLLLALAPVVSLLGEPIFGGARTFPQPDGSHVMLLLYGDEFYMRAETEDGFTVVRDPQTGWICYAKPTSDGSDLVSTGVRYAGKAKSARAASGTISSQTPGPRHADLSLAARTQKARSTRDLLLGEQLDHWRVLALASAPLTAQAAAVANDPAMGLPPRRPDIAKYNGTVYGIVLLFDFRDQPAGPSPALDDYVNSVNRPNFHKPDGRANSLRTYFDEVSGGAFVLSNYVFGVFRATNTFAWYDSLGYGQGARLLLAQGLAEVKAAGFDFSRLSVNENQQVRGLSLMYTGSPKTWAQGMWFHAGLWDTGPSYDGVSFRRYCSTPLSTDPRTLIHEHGHLSAGWPDLYSYNGAPTGVWDVMSGLATELPNPYLLYQNGWLDAVNIRGSYGPRTVESLNSHQALVYYDPAQPDEFFFLRPYTRQLLYCPGIPDQGLSVWRINRLGNNGSYPDTALEVEMVHADNVLDDYSEQVLFKAADRNAYTDLSAPCSSWQYHAHKSQRSGLNLTEISDPGQTMTFRLSRPLYFYAMDDPFTPAGLWVSIKVTAVCDLPLTFTAAGLPPGLAIDRMSGLITGTAPVPGLYDASITATASDGSQNTLRLAWRVGGEPATLSFSAIADRLSIVGQTTSFKVQVQGGTNATFSAEGLPVGPTMDPLTGVVSGVATVPGIYDVAVRAIARNGSETSARFTWAVLNSATGPSPVAWYPLATNAKDMSGRDRNGTVYGAPVFAFPGARFDGADDCIVTPRVVSEDFSISFFLNTGVSGPDTGSLWYNGAGLVDGDAAGLADDFGISLLGDRISFGVGSFLGDSTVTCTNKVTDRLWHHVCVTRRSADGEMAIYIDGRLDSVDFGPAGPKTSSALLKIGSLQTARNYFQGGLADVKFYDRFLGADDIFRESKAIPAEPRYRIGQALSSTSGCTLSWQSIPGEVYQVEWSASPAEGFVPVGAPVPAGNDYTLTRTVPFTAGHGFYRVRRL